MQGNQLSFFSEEEENSRLKKQKKPKLGRYERIKRELEENESDPHKIFIEISSESIPTSNYTFVDLFCGAGGMTQGLVQAGFQAVASVEISPIASATHKRNFPRCHHFCGEIEKFNPVKWLEEIDSPEVHLVAGGPPCQGFSVAGKRDPKDPRNRLFYEFIRIVAKIRPWYVVMENVPGILTIQKGDVRAAITEAFKSIGYDNVSVAILESANYGVPQIRPRAIFIANRLGMPNPYPKAQLLTEEYKPIESAISDLPEYTRIPEINHEWTKHSPEYMERIAKVPPGGSLYKKYADALKKGLKDKEAILWARVEAFRKSDGELEAGNSRFGLFSICVNPQNTYYTARLRKYPTWSERWRWNCIALDQKRRLEAINKVLLKNTNNLIN